jgi:hypothetical protein
MNILIVLKLQCGKVIDLNGESYGYYSFLFRVVSDGYISVYHLRLIGGGRRWALCSEVK